MSNTILQNPTQAACSLIVYEGALLLPTHICLAVGWDSCPSATQIFYSFSSIRKGIFITVGSMGEAADVEGNHRFSVFPPTF